VDGLDERGDVDRGGIAPRVADEYRDMARPYGIQGVNN
jgi:hypothetical protein